MPFSERIEELDREIRSTVARAIAELRDDLTQRLRRSHDELLLHLEELEPTLPDELLPVSELAPAVEQEAATARRGAFAELRDGLAALDHARSQAEVLSTLLAESERYASRALLLLTRGGELRGWGGRGGHGFGDEDVVRSLALSLPEEGPWAALAAGRGTVPLAASQCADLCSRLEGELPREGALVPLVLRDQVAAALYADRTGGDELLLEPLQALVYAAAQAIESLPFRERGSTATLHLAMLEPAEEAPAEAAQSPTAAPEAPPAVEGMIAAEPEPSPPETAPPPPAAAPEPAAPAPEEPAAETPWVAEEAWPEEPAVASTESSPYEAAGAPPAMVAEAAPVWGEPEEDTTGMAVSLDDTAAIVGAPVEEDTTGDWRFEEEAVAVAEPEPPPYEEPAAPPATQAWRSAPTAAWEMPRYEEPAPVAPPPAEPAAEEPPPQPPETVMLRSAQTEPVPSPYAPPAPAEEAPPAAPPAPGPAQTVRIAAVGSEVQPPTGVQGPGWAFATARVPATGEEALHEEARRLARLLVSEIKLYNEEQVDEGRRNRDLYERLKDDIDRSRQMYEERVESRILNTTDYFYQELVRILAAGDARALGI